MRSKSGQFYITTAKYQAVNEEGLQAKITANYVVEGLTFGEAEEKTLRELSKFVEGECKLTRDNPAPFSEIFFSDNADDDKWYNVKVKIKVADEKTGKLKKSSVAYLVQGKSTASAEHNVREIFSDSVIDYEITNVAETTILDVFVD